VDPPPRFFYESDSLPEAEIRRALSIWSENDTYAAHARDARVLLVIRAGDWSRVRALASTHAGHAYLVVPKRMTWPEARAACKEAGGHLATVTSADENAFVQYLTPKDWAFAPWLGLWTDGASRSWVTGEAFTYAKWWLPADRYKSGAACMGPDGGWRTETEPGEVRRPFVIEWDG
jgi:hypothetical protein